MILEEFLLFLLFFDFCSWSFLDPHFAIELEYRINFNATGRMPPGVRLAILRKRHFIGSSPPALEEINYVKGKVVFLFT